MNKLKLQKTLYFDNESCWFTEDNPKMDYPYYRVGLDYEVYRKGQLVTVYDYNEYFETNRPEDKGKIVCSLHHGSYTIFNNYQEMIDTNWFKEVQ